MPTPKPRRPRPRAPRAAAPLTYGQHHVRLTPELQAWAVAKATSYRSVAAFITELVRTAYLQEEQAASVALRQAA